jgi:hypothetical protein
MAKRIVFLPRMDDSGILFDEREVTFDWVAGMSRCQNQKWIRNLHQSAKEQLGIDNLLEISSRSELTLGVELSAFNLKLKHEEVLASVECLYQGSKVFERGGPFTDLYSTGSKEAKQDSRLKSSGDLIHFEFNSHVWGLSDSPNFYDYLYILGLSNFRKSKELLEFQAFTDFAYSQSGSKMSHGRSFNCQARSAAIYSSLYQSDQLENFLDSPEKFTATSKSIPRTSSSQLDLF